MRAPWHEEPEEQQQPAHDNEDAKHRHDGQGAVRLNGAGGWLIGVGHWV